MWFQRIFVELSSVGRYVITYKMIQAIQWIKKEGTGLCKNFGTGKWTVFNLNLLTMYN